MLTREDDIDVHALRRQGWTITTIARHLGRDRKTIRTYLAGDRRAGVRARTVEGPFEVFAPYCAQRLADDPHLWASTLFDELRDLGYVGSYPTMTRQIRTRGLRPACEPCRPATGRPIAVIDHPAGQETQWDWVELPDPPESWGWGAGAHLLVGALSHSGAWRGLLCESEEQVRRLIKTSSLADAHEAKMLLGHYVMVANMPETDRLWNTICQWWTEIEVLIVTGVTNARTEAANTTIKNIKRTGRGFRNPDNYKARILLRSAATRAA